MGDLGTLYKIYFSIFTNENNETLEEFGARQLKIRNHNSHSYRYYDEDGKTVSIDKEKLGGVYVQHLLDKNPPQFISYFITEDKDAYELVSGEVPPKDDEEKEGLEKLKNGLRSFVDKAIKDFVEESKRSLDKIVQSQEETNENLPKKRKRKSSKDES